MNGTVWVEVTNWRGVWIDRTLFGPVLRVGFLGFGISRLTLSDYLRLWRDTLKKLSK